MNTIHTSHQGTALSGRGASRRMQGHLDLQRITWTLIAWGHACMGQGGKNFVNSILVPNYTTPFHPTRSARLFAAFLLRNASVILSRLASHVEPKPAPVRELQAHHIEFYLDPTVEGGLIYADGKLIGRLPDIRRL